MGINKLVVLGKLSKRKLIRFYLKDFLLNRSSHPAHRKFKKILATNHYFVSWTFHLTVGFPTIVKIEVIRVVFDLKVITRLIQWQVFSSLGIVFKNLKCLIDWRSHLRKISPWRRSRWIKFLALTGILLPLIMAIKLFGKHWLAIEFWNQLVFAMVSLLSFDLWNKAPCRFFSFVYWHALAFGNEST